MELDPAKAGLKPSMLVHSCQRQDAQEQHRKQVQGVHNWHNIAGVKAISIAQCT